MTPLPHGRLAGSHVGWTRRRWLPVTLTALVVGLGGVLPHLFFSLDTGEHLLFEGAFDESFYLLAMSGTDVAWNDYPARSIMRLLMIAMSEQSLRFAIISDVLWPAVVVMAAGALALTILAPLRRPWIAIIAVTFLFTFGSDLLAFNSSAIFPSGMILSFRLATLPLEWRQLVPDAFTPFLYIYRTPEPQLSLAFFFLHLAIAVRFVDRRMVTVRDWILLFAASASCIGIYPFFAAASLITVGLVVLALLLTCSWKRAGGVAMILTASTLLFIWLTARTHLGEAQSMLFSSRLPLIAPSLFYAITLAPLFVWIFRREISHDSLLMFALFCLMVPFATLNQHVLTGLMLQTLNWERYINYTFVTLGTLLFIVRVCTTRQPSRFLERARMWLRPLWLTPTLTRFATSIHPGNVRIAILAIYLIAIAWFVYGAQLATYRQFMPYNLRVAAYAKILDQVTAQLPPREREVTLDDPALDAQVRARTQAAVGLTFNSYTDLVTGLKKHNSNAPTASDRQQWGFMHAIRLGFSPDSYEAELLLEVDQRACWPHLMFHFSFLECAPYVSDFRKYSPEYLKRRIRDIRREYAQFRETAAVGSESIVLSRTPLPDAVGLSTAHKLLGTLKLSTRLSGFAPLTSVVIFAYMQAPRN